MADIKKAYADTAEVDIASALNSLGSNAKAQGLKIDNATTTKYLDVLVGGTVTTGASMNKPGHVDIYVTASADDGGTFAGGASGAKAAFTGPVANLMHLGKVAVSAVSTAYTFGPFSIAKAFGGTMPPHWTIIVANHSTGALAAAGNVIDYNGVTETSSA